MAVIVCAVVVACGGGQTRTEATLTAPSAQPVTPVHLRERGPVPVVDGHIAWVAYDAARLESDRRHGRLVFLNFSAEWCAACKVDERTSLETDVVRAALMRADATPMRVDMTNEEPARETLLETFGRDALPAYAIVLPDGSYDVLPKAITGDVVAAHLREAERKLSAR
jgi:thiol:disulfide interchange protein